MGVPSTGRAPPVLDDEDDPADDAVVEVLLPALEDGVPEVAPAAPEDAVLEVALAAPEDALDDAPLDAALEEGPAPELLLSAPEAPLLVTPTEEELAPGPPLEALAAKLLAALADDPARLVEPATLDGCWDELAPDDEDDDVSSPVVVVHAEPTTSADNSQTRFILDPLFSCSLTKIASRKMVVFGGCGLRC